MGFIAPFGTIFFAGWWCFTGTRAAQTAWSTFGLQTASTMVWAVQQPVKQLL